MESDDVNILKGEIDGSVRNLPYVFMIDNRARPEGNAGREKRKSGSYKTFPLSSSAVSHS